MTQKTYEASEPQHLAFIGLGVMGFHMAGHLAQAGTTLRFITATLPKQKPGLSNLKA